MSKAHVTYGNVLLRKKHLLPSAIVFSMYLRSAPSLRPLRGLKRIPQV